MATDQPVHFTVLGPVEVVVAAGGLPVPGALRRGLLALLLLHANQVVGYHQIVEGLWGPTPPATARAQVRAAVSAVRGVLRRTGSDHLLATQPAGYRLGTAPACLDLLAFRDDVARARMAVAGHDHAGAAQELRCALGRWRGAALTGATGSFVEASRARLEEERLSAVEDLAAAELALRRHAELVPLLTELVWRHPVRERMCRQLSVALHRCGRSAEALAVLRRLRAVLAEEHGIDPSAEVVAVERAILRGHPDLEPPDPPADSPIVRPAQLPPDPDPFVGRGSELAGLDAAAGAGGGTTAPVLVIGGPAGIGKTTLALHWAHRHRDRYPDGQLFVDLRGHRRDSALPVADALRHLVRALGVPADRCPTEPAELAGLFRSLSDGRRILVVLDNAATSGQVSALVPGSGSCLVVVTSRHRLEALAASFRPHLVVLGPLRRVDSSRLLSAVAGRRGPGPALAARFARSCGDYPLALRIVAAQLASRPAGAASELAARLAGGPDRVTELALEGGSVSVRAAFDSSYADLSPVAARLFRLLSLVPSSRSSSVGLDHAVAVAGAPVAAVRPALDELTGLHLLAGTGLDRYGWHDLVRAYAAARALADEPAASRAAALNRLVDYLLAGAAAANQLITPDRQGVAVRVAAPAGTAPPGDRDSALAWLDAELAMVLAVAGRAGEYGRPEATWQLAYLVSGYCTRRGRNVELAEVCEHALAGLAVTGTPVVEAAIRQCLGVAYLLVRRLDEAEVQVGRALAVFEALPDADGAGRARNNLGVILRWQRRYPEALAVYQQAHAWHGAARDNDLAVLLNNIGEVYAEMGELAAATQFLERALTVRVELADPYGEGITLLNLGGVALQQGDDRAATGRFDLAAAALREAGDRHALPVALTQLGGVARRRGAVREALRHLRAALALQAEAGDRHGEATTRAALAATLLDAGDRAGARRQLDLVQELRLTHPDPWEPARDRELVADLVRRLGAHTDRIRNS